MTQHKYNEVEEIICNSEEIICDSEECNQEDRYFTFETDKNDQLVLDQNSLPVIIKVDPVIEEENQGQPIFRALNTTVTLSAECKTRLQSGTNRRACRSEKDTFTVPSGYYFSVDDSNATKISGYGSEHKVFVEWSNYIQIIPGVTVPRTVSLYVTARSDGLNTTGSCKARLTAVYYKL